MPESCRVWLATGPSAIHPCDRPPKIVQVLTIGEISSTECEGNSLDRAFYDGLRIAFYVRNHDSCWKEGDGLMSTSESLGHVGVIHPLDPGDASVIAQIRSATRAQKGAPWRIEARKFYDALLEGVSPRDDVTFESATVGGVAGVWVRPASSRSDEAILHVHGGWFVSGSATAYRHLVGHIAARAGASAFVPDYRLAPEHPFPAADDDVLPAYSGMDEK